MVRVNEMRVDVTIEEVLNDTEEYPIGINVTCSRCHHCIFAGGTKLKSLKWTLHTLADECPRGETNYYGPPRYDFGYYGDDPLTAKICRQYEQATGMSVPPWPKRPLRPPYGLTDESAWEDLALAEEY